MPSRPCYGQRCSEWYGPSCRNASPDERLRWLGSTLSCAKRVAWPIVGGSKTYEGPEALADASLLVPGFLVEPTAAVVLGCVVLARSEAAWFAALQLKIDQPRRCVSPGQQPLPYSGQQGSQAGAGRFVADAVAGRRPPFCSREHVHLCHVACGQSSCEAARRLASDWRKLDVLGVVCESALPQAFAVR